MLKNNIKNLHKTAIQVITSNTEDYITVKYLEDLFRHLGGGSRHWWSRWSRLGALFWFWCLRLWWFRRSRLGFLFWFCRDVDDHRLEWNRRQKFTDLIPLFIEMPPSLTLFGNLLSIGQCYVLRVHGNCHLFLLFLCWCHFLFLLSRNTLKSIYVTVKIVKIGPYLLKLSSK